MDEIQLLVDQMQYIMLHAPRQSGKTTVLLALADHLNRTGRYFCVYLNVETCQTTGHDTARAVRTILANLRSPYRRNLPDGFTRPSMSGLMEKFGPDRALKEALARWAERSAAPLVVLIDKIDKVWGDSLISVLRQLRSGYAERPRDFPQSVILCANRDVRDCEIPTSAGEFVLGGSVLDMNVKSLRLGDFTESQVRSLLGQHVAETGQVFSDRALAAVWRHTRGQPWLVSALAHECCNRTGAARASTLPIRLGDVLRARERLIRRRDIHLHLIVENLRDPRVRRVIEPPMLGGQPDPCRGDIDYARDLGLLARQPRLAIANPIYGEALMRPLSALVMQAIAGDWEWYSDGDDRPPVGKLLGAFQEYFRQTADHWLRLFDYKEAGPQLLRAILLRLVLIGARVDRQHGTVRMRTDLLVYWRRLLSGEDTRDWQKVVIDWKLRQGSLEALIRRGVERTVAYMERAGADEGHLVIFDRTEGATWDEKIFCRKEKAGGKQVTVWGM